MSIIALAISLGVSYQLLKLERKVDHNSKIVGNIKINDLDDDFWKEDN